MFTGEQGENGWKGQHTWTDETKRLLIEDAEAIYQNYKLSIHGEERRTYYDIDCNRKTRSEFLCTPQHCSESGVIADNYEMRRQVQLEGTHGLYCCTSSLPTVCAKEEKAGECKNLERSVGLLQSASTVQVYKVNQDVMCCNPAVDLTEDEKIDQDNNCAKVKTIWFLVWLTPFCCFGVNLLIACFCLVNGVYLNTTDASKLERTLKQFVLLGFTILFMMWVSTAIAGASMRLTGTLLSFCVAGLVALFLWIYFELGSHAITIGARGSRLMQSLISMATSDVVRACMLMALNVLIPVGIVVNMMNQSARRMRGQTRSSSKFTDGMNFFLRNVKNWNWANILLWVNWICLGYWLFSIGVAKLTQVFLSWLNEELLKISFVSVCVIFFGIGFTMFMLPPVPGIPVYLAAGVIIASRARSTDVGFGGGIVCASILSFVLKLLACCGQYTIGYCMGQSVKVQQLIGVDKVPTRAIQRILEVRGLSLSKVAVLVGGPDWPTSVLCGILKLNLLQVIWGTCPVIFVSTPVVAAGAFMAGPDEPGTGDNPCNRDDVGGIWETLTPVMIGIAALGQLASAIIAIYYIQEVIYKEGVELAKPRVEHEPVAKLTKAEEEFRAAYKEILDWNTLTWQSKVPLMACALGMAASIFIMQFFDEACFRPFQVTDKISCPYDKHGLNGEAFSIYRPPGVAAHVLLGVCVIIHFGFLQRSKYAAQAQIFWKRNMVDRAVADGHVASGYSRRRARDTASDESSITDAGLPAPGSSADVFAGQKSLDREPAPLQSSTGPSGQRPALPRSNSIRKPSKERPDNSAGGPRRQNSPPLANPNRV